MKIGAVTAIERLISILYISNVAGFPLSFSTITTEAVAVGQIKQAKRHSTNKQMFECGKQRKINASINNSKIFKTIVDEYGSFYNYLRTFTKDRTIYETDKTTNGLSDALSKDLQNRGMTFVGSVIIYAYLQAIGVIYSHDKDCYLYKSGK